jgi:hypothetical protein
VGHRTAGRDRNQRVCVDQWRERVQRRDCEPSPHRLHCVGHRTYVGACAVVACACVRLCQGVCVPELKRVLWLGDAPAPQACKRPPPPPHTHTHTHHHHPTPYAHRSLVAHCASVTGSNTTTAYTSVSFDNFEVASATYASCPAPAPGSPVVFLWCGSPNTASTQWTFDWTSGLIGAWPAAARAAAAWQHSLQSPSPLCRPLGPPSVQSVCARRAAYLVTHACKRRAAARCGPRRPWRRLCADVYGLFPVEFVA